MDPWIGSGRPSISRWHHLLDRTAHAAPSQTIGERGVSLPQFLEVNFRSRLAREPPVGRFISTKGAFEPLGRSSDILAHCGASHDNAAGLDHIGAIWVESSPSRFARGAWRYDKMIGYTSVGAGTCLIEVRLNCRPEVTLHRLRRPEN
jgi:uncharacterized protein